MRGFLISALCAVPLLLRGQLRPELPEYQGGIEQVTIKKYGKRSAVVVDLSGQRVDIGGTYGPTGLKTTIRFGPDGRPSGREVKQGKFILVSETYDRDTVEGKVYLRTKHMTNPFLSGTSVQEIILDDFSRPVAWQMQLATAEVDNRLHRVLERDAVYMNGRLASYKRMELDHRSDTLLYVVVELEYDSSGRLTSLIERTNGYYSYTKPNASTGMSERVNVDPKESQVINKWAYRFDPDGKLSTLTQCRLGEQYSVEERSLVLIYSFEYDKQGNWTKKFVQAGSEPRKISEAQSIKYRKRK